MKTKPTKNTRTARPSLQDRAIKATKILTARVGTSWRSVAIKSLILLIFLLAGWTLDQVLSEKNIAVLKRVFQRESALTSAVEERDHLEEACELCVIRSEHARALKLVAARVSQLDMPEKLKLLNRFLSLESLKSIRQSLVDLKISIVERMAFREREQGDYNFIKTPDQ